MRKWLVMATIGLGLIVVALVVAVVASGVLDDRRIEAAARATPEIGPSELALGGAVASSALGADVNPSTVLALRGEPEVVVIDVRTPGEYASAHIPGTLLVPLNELETRASEVPKDKGVMLVCRSGNRSAQAVQLLSDLGYDNVHTMRGGMRAWSRAGYPSEP